MAAWILMLNQALHRLFVNRYLYIRIWCKIYDHGSGSKKRLKRIQKEPAAVALVVVQHVLICFNSCCSIWRLFLSFTQLPCYDTMPLSPLESQSNFCAAQSLSDNLKLIQVLYNMSIAMLSQAQDDLGPNVWECRQYYLFHLRLLAHLTMNVGILQGCQLHPRAGFEIKLQVSFHAQQNKFLTDCEGKHIAQKTQERHT